MSLSTSPTAATSNGIPKSVLQALSNGNSDPADDGMDDGEVGTVGGQGGKKKGTIYRCENCSKVRTSTHPSSPSNVDLFPEGLDLTPPVRVGDEYACSISLRSSAFLLWK